MDADIFRIKKTLQKSSIHGMGPGLARDARRVPGLRQGSGHLQEQPDVIKGGTHGEKGNGSKKTHQYRRRPGYVYVQGDRYYSATKGT